MMQEDEYSSDTSDEDYVVAEDDQTKDLSEEDSAGDDDLEENDVITKNKLTKAVKKKSGKKVNPLLAQLETKSTDEGAINMEEEKKIKNDNKVKEHEKNLWADFLADVEVQPAAPKRKANSWASVLGKPKPKQNTEVKSSSIPSSSVTKKTEPIVTKPSTVKVTKVFEFAGEEVRLTEEVPADSAEAKAKLAEDRSVAGGSLKRPGASGFLDMINKKKKLSVLEKTKVDWNSFKSDQGIEEELEHHKKSKSGFLEKQAFLERADLRQFEIEKSMRTSSRSKR